MFVKVIKSYRDVVAICDKDLLGKVFTQGDFQLDVKESFYKGEEKTPEEIISIIKEYKIEDATFNIVGQKAIKIAKNANLIDESSIGEIEGIPFALVLI